MNVSVVTGRILRNAVLNGVEHKALKFIVVATSKSEGNDSREFNSQVPCVLFNPSEDFAQFMISEGKNRNVELTGKIVRFRYDVEGQRRYATEVVVDQKSLRIIG